MRHSVYFHAFGNLRGEWPSGLYNLRIGDLGDLTSQLTSQKAKALVWKWREIWAFRVDISALKTPTPTNEVPIFKQLSRNIFKVISH